MGSTVVCPVGLKIGTELVRRICPLAFLAKGATGGEDERELIRVCDFDAGACAGDEACQLLATMVTFEGDSLTEPPELV